MGWRAQVSDLAIEAKILLTWKHRGPRENGYKQGLLGWEQNTKNIRN